MNNKIFVTCAVTGSGDTAKKHPDLPKTPKQIANAAIEAAKAGAAIVHIHVREPDGRPSRRIELYDEVVDRIRSSETDVILNLTTGMGGDLEIGSGKNPLDVGPNTDMANIMERIANAEKCLPEICSLDCGSLNFGNKTMLVVNTPNDIRKAAKRLKEIDVKPEIETFDLGNMWFGSQLVKEGLIKDPPLFQICLDIPWGAPATPSVMKAFIDLIPKGSYWSAFAISKMEMPYVSQTVSLGGNVRVGLEDNLYLEKGVLASNAQLVEKAIELITNMGVSILTPEETRKKLKLTKHK